MFRTFLAFLAVGMASVALAGSPMIFHTELQPVVAGHSADIAFNISSFDGDVYEARLFYRSRGASDYRSTPMRQEGLSLTTKIDTKKLTPGHIEYYLAMQAYDGRVFYYPAVDPQNNPLSFEVIAGAEEPVNQALAEIIVLSPEPESVVPQDEMLIAVSVPDENLDIDPARTRLLIDGVNVSQLVNNEGILYMLTPKKMAVGHHNLEFKIFNSSGNLLGKKEWSFRVSSSGNSGAAFTSRTNFYLDNRFQNISKQQDNFLRAGLNFDGAYKDLDIGLRLQYNNNPGYSSQNATRYSALMAYNFTPRTRVYVKGGDFSGNYDPLTFWNRRVLGVSTGLKSAWFDLDVSLGTTANAVEGSATQDSSGAEVVSRYGTYKETFIAIRPVFNFGRYVSWGLNLVNGKEDPGSIKYGANPRESLVMGSTLNINLDNNRVRIKSSVQASIRNTNARGKVEFDTLAKQFDIPSGVKPYVDLLESTGFLTLSQGLAPIPSLALQAEAYFSYFDQLLKVAYKSIDANYTTAGNPYLLRGVRGLYVSDNIRLLDNQIFMNLYFNAYTDNLSQEGAETDNKDFGASISYFPLTNLPGVTLTFGNQSRINNADPNNEALYREDNSTQRYGLSSSYKFNTASVKNTVTVSFNNFTRDDRAIATNQSSFNVFSLGLRNQFDAPFATRLGFSQTNSTFGSGATASTTEIARYDGGVEYLYKNSSGNMSLKPFANVMLQQIKGSQSYNRLNYSAGAYLRTEKFGALSLRWDYMDYSDLAGVDWKDTIVNVRYDVTF